MYFRNKDSGEEEKVFSRKKEVKLRGRHFRRQSGVAILSVAGTIRTKRETPKKWKSLCSRVFNYWIPNPRTLV